MPTESTEILDDIELDLEIENITLDDIEINESDGNNLKNVLSQSEEDDSQIKFKELEVNDYENIENLEIESPLSDQSNISQELYSSNEIENVEEIDLDKNKALNILNTTKEAEIVVTEDNLMPENQIDNVSFEGEIKQDYKDYINNIIGEKADENLDTIETLNVIERSQEPEIPKEKGSNNIKEEVIVITDKKEPIIEEESFETNNDIISIDGEQLDKLIFGNDYVSKSIKTQEESIDNNIYANENFELIINEENEDLNNKLSETNIEEKKYELENKSETMPEDLEEDEPITLSMDELNNINIAEISEEKQESEQLLDLSQLKTTEQEIQISENSLNEIVETETAIENNRDFSEVIDLKEPKIGSEQISIIEEQNLETESVQEYEEEPVIISNENLLENENISSFEENIPISDEENLEGSKINLEAKQYNIDNKIDNLSDSTKSELKKVLKYLDGLLENLPEEKIQEFAKSEYYDLYIKILEKLGI